MNNYLTWELHPDKMGIRAIGPSLWNYYITKYDRLRWKKGRHKAQHLFSMKPKGKKHAWRGEYDTLDEAKAAAEEREGLAR